MRRTAKYSLVLGFTFSSIAIAIVTQFGTGFEVMTGVLYLYGIVAVLAGILGYRKAYLDHAESHPEPRLKHIVGLHRLGELFEEETWLVTLEHDNFETGQLRLTDDLVSVRRDIDGETFLSYPRNQLVGLRKDQS